MDMRTGRLYADEEVDLMRDQAAKGAEAAEERKRFEVLERNLVRCVDPTDEQLAAMKVGRNEPCPCGSGRKFKRCCYRARVQARNEALAVT